MHAIMTLLETHQTTISGIRTVFLSEVESNTAFRLQKHCLHRFDDRTISALPDVRRTDSRINVLKGVSNESEIASANQERQSPPISIRFRTRRRLIIRPYSPQCKPSISNSAYTDMILNAATGRTTRLGCAMYPV